MSAKSKPLPKGYRVTVSPCKLAGGGTALEPRVWLNGSLLFLNPGATFEDREKAREYGKTLARIHAGELPPSAL